MRVPASAEVSSQALLQRVTQKIGDPEKHEDSDEEYSTDMESTYPMVETVAEINKQSRRITKMTRTRAAMM